MNVLAAIVLGLTLGARGQAQGPIVSLLRVPDGGIQPQVARGAGGDVHLLYFKGDPAHGDLFYVHSRDEGATWSTPIQVNSTPGDAIARACVRGGQLALGQNGTVHVVWLGAMVPAGQRSDGMPLLYARLDPERGAFSAERNLQGATVALDGGASVAADASGDVDVVWHAAKRTGDEERSRVVWLATSSDGGNTFSHEEQISDGLTGACACCDLKALRDQNTIWVLYRSAEDNVDRDVYLLTSTDNGQSFQSTQMATARLTQCPMSTFTLDEEGGSVYAGWEEKGVVAWNSPGAEPPKLITAKHTAKYPAVAANARGEVCLCWVENTGGANVLAWQGYTSKHIPIEGGNGRKAGVPADSFISLFARKDGSFAILY